MTEKTLTLYRGLTSKDPRVSRLEKGRIPAYTWWTDSEGEAARYARMKVKGVHGRVSGGVPVVVEADLPVSSLYSQFMGYGEVGSPIYGRSRYFKTARPTKGRVLVKRLKM